MGALFNLRISCTAEENYWAEYDIGLFKTIEGLNIVRNRLMNKEGRFSNPDCKARISEIDVVGEGDDYTCVYRFWGQNTDSSFVGDIIESPCYIDKSTAIQELMKAKKRTPRQQWNLDTITVGKCNW